MSVYVDDFKMAGLRPNLSSMWAKIRTLIDLDDPVPLHGSTYLGCRQDNVLVTEDIQRAIDHQNALYNKTARAGHVHSQQKVSDAEEHMEETPPDTSTRGVQQPSSGIGAISKNCGNTIKALHSTHPVKVWEYNMTGHAAGCVDRYI